MMTLIEKLDEMYERDEWNPEWYVEIKKALEKGLSKKELFCKLCPFSTLLNGFEENDAWDDLLNDKEDNKI
jgi:hypothetical protein